MIKPLQQILPALSGDVCIACQVDIISDKKYNGNDIDETLYHGIVRNGSLLPLTSDKYLPICKCNLITSDYSMDIRKFYSTCRDTFYEPVKKKEGISLVKEYPESNFNNDYSWGCRRINRNRNCGYQYMFFAPIWVEDCIPDSIEIYINFDKYPQKRITIPLSVKSDNNYLPEYLDRYMFAMDDKVMRIDKDAQYSYIFGTSVVKGGFSIGRSRLCKDLWSEYRTINRFDSIIASMYKNSGFIIKQILPLAFLFNLDDILTASEKKLKNIRISASYINKGKKLPLYSFDTDYVNYNFQYYNWIDNNYYLQNTSSELPNNSLNLNERTATIYSQHLHKIVPQYSRWELCGNNGIPYIINLSDNYNISGLSGRYYHTPMKVPYHFSLKISDINKSIDQASIFFKTYQGYWFDQRKDNYSDIYHNTVLHRGILYNFNNTNYKRFGVDLDIVDTNESVSGPYIGISNESQGMQGLSFQFDNRLSHLITGSDNARYYPLNNLYIIKNDNVKDIKCIGYGVLTYNPILIENYSIERTQETITFHANQPYSYSILSEILQSARYIFEHARIINDKYCFETDKLLEFTNSANYINIPYINNMNDMEWDYYVSLLKSMTEDGGTRLYKTVTDNNGRIFYREIFNATDINHVTDSVYRKVNGTIVDYNDLEYTGTSLAAIKKYKIPVMLRLHISDGLIWMYNPKNITSKIIKKALSIFCGNEYDESDSISYSNYIVWELNGDKYEELSSEVSTIGSYTDKDIINELVSVWSCQKFDENIQTKLFQDLYSSNGFITGLSGAETASSISEYLGRDHIDTYIRYYNMYGFGFHTLDELIGYYGESIHDSIDIDNIYRYDFNKGAFIDEPPLTELYITTENMYSFYRQILKMYNEPESLLYDIENVERKKCWLPLRYVHDLDIAINGNGKLYISGKLLFDNEIGAEQYLCITCNCGKDSNGYYIVIGNDRHYIDSKILNGKKDIQLSDLGIKSIADVFNKLNYNIEHFENKLGELINKSANCKIWYIEEVMPVRIIHKFINLLKIKKATARLFHIAYPTNYDNIVTRPASSNNIYANLKNLNANDEHKGIFISNYKNFMVPELINDTSEMPYWNYTGSKEKQIIRFVSEEEAKRYSESYKLCSLPSVNYKLNGKNDIRLQLNLYVKPDTNSFYIDRHEDGIIADTEKILTGLLRQKDSWRLLPFIKYPLLSYLYSLPYTVYPIKFNMPCNLVSRNKGVQSELISSFIGNIELYRYFGWIKPLLSQSPIIPTIWGKYKKDSLLCDEYHDNIYGPLFLNKSGQYNTEHKEKYITTNFTYKGAEQNIIERELIEDNWFNDSIIIWLPDTVTYDYGIVSEIEIKNDLDLPYKAFKQAIVRHNIYTENISEDRWKYLFFRYTTQYLSEPSSVSNDNTKMCHLKFVFNLI